MSVVTDPIADMLTRIRNALHGLHKDVGIPSSKVKVSLASILQEEGYIKSFNTDDEKILIDLKYHQGKPAISGMRRVSKSSRRVYVGANDIPRVQNGLGICILSTSHGVMAGATAQEKHVGGEVLCEIW